MSTFAKIWVSNSCGQLFIFEDVPIEDGDIDGWWDTNDIDDVVRNNFNSCEWGEYESTENIKTPEGGWAVDEDSDDEEDEEEECAICEESVQRDDVDNVDYNDDVGLWCCHKEECLRVFWKGDDFIDGIEDIRHKLRAATRKNVAIKITNTLISGIMIDAVNRAKPCRKNQCHAFTKKGFRCKNKQETKMVSPEMISQKETKTDFCKTHR